MKEITEDISLSKDHVSLVKKEKVVAKFLLDFEQLEKLYHPDFEFNVSKHVSKMLGPGNKRLQKVSGDKEITGGTFCT